VSIQGIETLDGLLPTGVFADAAEVVVVVIEAVGISILVIGGVITVYQAARDVLARRPAYQAARRSFGQALLLALEVLVAADVVQTVAVDLTLDSVATLGLLVIVRTVLSLSLAAELEGFLPWRKQELELKSRQLEIATPQPSTTRPAGR
jgi:uncharacterized membrane protein